MLMAAVMHSHEEPSNDASSTCNIVDNVSVNISANWLRYMTEFGIDCYQLLQDISRLCNVDLKKNQNEEVFQIKGFYCNVQKVKNHLEEQYRKSKLTHVKELRTTNTDQELEVLNAGCAKVTFQSCVQPAKDLLKFIAYAAQQNFDVIDVKDNGNCMFLALADQVGYDETDGDKKLRKEIVDYLGKHPDMMKNPDVDAIEGRSVSEYLEEMNQDGTWGDGIVLSAAARLFHRPIELFQSDGQIINIAISENSPGSTPIRLGYVALNDQLGRNHYVSVKPKQQKSMNNSTNVHERNTAVSNTEIMSNVNNGSDPHGPHPRNDAVETNLNNIDVSRHMFSSDENNTSLRSLESVPPGNVQKKRIRQLKREIPCESNDPVETCEKLDQHPVDRIEKQAHPSVGKIEAERNQPSIDSTVEKKNQSPFDKIEAKKDQPPVDKIEAKNDQPPVDKIEVKKDQPPVDSIEVNKDQPPVDRIEAKKDQPPVDKIEAKKDQPPVYSIEANKDQPPVDRIEAKKDQPPVDKIEVKKVEPTVDRIEKGVQPVVDNIEKIDQPPADRIQDETGQTPVDRNEVKSEPADDKIEEKPDEKKSMVDSKTAKVNNTVNIKPFKILRTQSNALSFQCLRKANSFTIQICKKNIVNDRADVLVNPLNDSSPGIEAILRIAGQNISEECSKKSKGLEVGDMFHSSSGKICTTKHLLHVLAPNPPRFATGSEDTSKILQQIFLNCLVYSAEKLTSVSTISLPPISIGGYGVQLVTRSMFRAFEEFDSYAASKEKGALTLRNIKIHCQDKIADEMIGIFKTLID